MTTDRLLEETFQAILAPALPGVSVRKRIEGQSPDPDAQRCPAVLVLAEDRQEWRAMKVAGRYGRECFLKLECRIGATSDPATLPRLVSDVESAIASAGPPAGWQFLQVNAVNAPSDVKDITRIQALTFMVFCLPV